VKNIRGGRILLIITSYGDSLMKPRRNCQTLEHDLPEDIVGCYNVLTDYISFGTWADANPEGPCPFYL
jgi:hypothetical protein